MGSALPVGVSRHFRAAAYLMQVTSPNEMPSLLQLQYQILGLGSTEYGK